MTERKWTPGPWVASSSNGTEVSGPDGEWIARVMCQTSPHNAHLISAAPDLYEALELLLAIGDFNLDAEGFATTSATLALAKARGES